MKPTYTTVLLALALFLLSADLSHANLLERLGLKRSSTTTTAPASLSTLTQEQMVAGLKEALAQGLQQAISQLGQTNGFLTNPLVRIPMPQQLESVEKTLRTLKQDKLADDFVITMNRAAEEAVPAAASVFVDSLKQMTISDAQLLLTGGTNAATQYFEKTTRTNLANLFLPIVQKATASNKVTAAYKQLVERASLAQNTQTNAVARSLGGLLGRAGEQYLSTSTLDVDAYVTDKALDGLFKMIAEQERLIRENPKARSTELLQKVFGALKK